MLINLWNNNNTQFDLPPVLFKRDQVVCISRLHIHWATSTKDASVLISSSLIEKSSMNPQQQLLFAFKKGNAQHLSFTPTHKEYYKIQCLDLQASEFNLIELNKEQSTKIKTIYIQLEVVDGVQHIAKEKK